MLYQLLLALVIAEPLAIKCQNKNANAPVDPVAPIDTAPIDDKNKKVDLDEDDDRPNGNKLCKYKWNANLTHQWRYCNGQGFVVCGNAPFPDAIKMDCARGTKCVESKTSTWPDINCH